MAVIIQDQYRNTNIETLINGIIEIREKHRVKALQALRDDVMNLQTAKGDALDLWGRLLKFSRFIDRFSLNEEDSESSKSLDISDSLIAKPAALLCPST